MNIVKPASIAFIAKHLFLPFFLTSFLAQAIAIIPRNQDPVKKRVLAGEGGKGKKKEKAVKTFDLIATACRLFLQKPDGIFLYRFIVFNYMEKNPSLMAFITDLK